MVETLQNEFDVIVVGTGLTESVIAAAASRIGKIVLHIDPNEFYGGNWASFNFTSLTSFAQKCQQVANDESSSSTTSFMSTINSQLLNVKEEWRDPETEEGCSKKEEILKEFRRFNIDLSPKLLFSRGALVELLISSNISRYAEFRAADHVLTLIADQLKLVPSSRADVFNTKELTVVEKRLLMKFLTSCVNYDGDKDEWRAHYPKTYLEYLRENHLTEKLIHYILNAIAMADERTEFQDGMEKTKKFLTCIGRYGNTPFLFPMYGCGEIPQCFCRLCAVFGGVYCLHRSIEKINFTKNQDDGKPILESVQSDNQQITAKHLVFGHGTVNSNILKVTSAIPSAEEESHKCGGLARGILVTSKPLGTEEMNKGGGGVSFIKLNLDDRQDDGAFIFQLSHFSGTVPKGYYLFHLVTKSVGENAETDLKPYIEKIFGATDDNGFIYSLYFNIPSCIKCSSNLKTDDSNVYLTCGPFFELDYDRSIQQAKSIFEKMYPDEEFLPRAPDPEEIILGGDEENTEGVNDEDVVEEAKEQSETNVPVVDDEQAAEAQETTTSDKEDEANNQLADNLKQNLNIE